MDDYEIEYENWDSPPVMLARAPGQVATQPESSGAVVRRGAASGNPNFDPITGKFAGKKLRNLQIVAQTVQGGALPTQSGAPTGTDPVAWARRMAMVRDAARTMAQMDVNQAQTFLNGKVADVNAVDINAFLADVQWQRMADLADVLNAKLKTGQSVKVIAPAGWVKQVFRNLTPAEGTHLVKALEGRGWDQNDILNKVVKKVRNKELRAQLEQLYGEAEPKEGKKLPAPAGTGKGG
jgi:hypothetical protein